MELTQKVNHFAMFKSLPSIICCSQKFLPNNLWTGGKMLQFRIVVGASVYSRAVREGTFPSKISDPPPKVVSNLVTSTLHQFN